MNRKIFDALTENYFSSVVDFSTNNNRLYLIDITFEINQIAKGMNALKDVGVPRRPS